MNAMLDTASPVETRRHRINLPHGAFFHRAALRAKIAAVHAGGEPAQVVRQQTVALFRAALDQGRALARETFEANGGGLACAGHLAHIEDELIREIFNYVTAYVHPAANGISVKDATTGMPLPLHPGAEQYYREIGLLK